MGKTLVMHARDKIEVTVDDDGTIRIEQSDVVGNDPSVVLVHPGDTAQLMAMLEKAQAEAESILRGEN